MEKKRKSKKSMVAPSFNGSIHKAMIEVGCLPATTPNQSLIANVKTRPKEDGWYWARINQEWQVVRVYSVRSISQCGCLIDMVGEDESILESDLKEIEWGGKVER